MRSAAAALGLVVGCTTIAGLDGDYVIGEEGGSAGAGPPSSAAWGADNASSAASGVAGGTAGSASVAGTGGAGVGGVGGTGAGGAGGGPPASCDAQYLLAYGYQYCSETTASCTFRVITAQAASCDDVCSMFGGECLGAFDNGQPCQVLGPVSCSYDMFGDIMCECSRGCGGGAPCSNGQSCQNGGCA